MQDANNRKNCVYGGGDIYGKSLYHLLNYLLNLNWCQKNKSINFVLMII